MCYTSRYSPNYMDIKGECDTENLYNTFDLTIKEGLYFTELHIG